MNQCQSLIIESFWTMKMPKLNDEKSEKWSRKKIQNLSKGIRKGIAKLLTLLTESIERPLRCSVTKTLLQKLAQNLFQESDKAVDHTSNEAPIVTEVDTNYFAKFHLKSLHQPIILYGRLFEEEGFQYVSFIFGKRVFIIELATDIFDIQERACEVIYSLIAKFGEIPKVSLFIKVSRLMAHIVAEIDSQDGILLLCQSVPEYLEILNLNEIIDLMYASHFLINVSIPLIKRFYDETLFFKQPFLEGLYVNKKAFGCVATARINASQSLHPIVLVLCDIITQSNFLWNDKPFAANAKYLKNTFKDAETHYEEIKLSPTNIVTNSDERGGIRFGDQILYEGPLDVIFG